MERIDCAVIGAGVVGLAVARALALRGHEVVILEAAAMFGSATSSRNSEVMHAGIYYPPGSLKARFCVQGRALLQAYCVEHGVAHRRVGKLLVATDPSQHARLAALAEQARANGVDDLQPLDGAQARVLEPALACSAALWSPSTGIIDSHGLMLALLGDAQAAGAVLAVSSPLLRARVTPTGIVLDVGGTEPMQLHARRVVNAAGLWAPQVAGTIDGLAPEQVPQAHFCKGSYFSCSGRAAFNHLVYPMPDAAGLGVHVTLDLAGQMRFGPDTEWLDAAGLTPDTLDYRVAPARMVGMAEAIRRYWPGLPDAALQPAYAGIRPKISGPRDAVADFRIDGPAEHGVPGLVNLYGIESPGLTACLALAEEVLLRLGRVSGDARPGAA